MTEKFTYDVFISYSSQDEAIVHPLAERLRDDGVEVWLDTWVLKPGDPISLKIQQGLEQSRVLLMCMSKAYFDSDWTTLEHHTLLFRDPTNEQRRFIPLLLEDCERPDVIAQFLHIDVRGKDDAAFKKISKSCGFDSTKATGAARSGGSANAHIITKNSIATLEGHSDAVISVAIDPKDKIALSGTLSGAVKAWDLSKKLFLEDLEQSAGAINCLEISPDGKHAYIGSGRGNISVWNLRKRRNAGTLRGHGQGVRCIAISTNGNLLISGSGDGTVKLWRCRDQNLIATLRGHKTAICCVAISPDGQSAISGSESGAVRIWDLERQDSKVRYEQNSSVPILSAGYSPQGNIAVTGLADSSIVVLDAEKGRPLSRLEGHSGPVNCVAVSPSGTHVISGSSDKTIRVWDLDTLAQTACLEGHAGQVYDIAVTRDGHQILSASDDMTLRVWDLARFQVAPASSTPTIYTNAKVVLVGESGVGKSGLALRLSENDWRETASTHGMSVTKLDLPNDPAVPAEREVWLWDFAGQPDYRLIHQLYMDETALALMVVDPQRDEPFAPLGHWEQALSRAVKHDPEKLLVAARCDRGGYVVGQRDIDGYLKGRGYAGHVSTSAKLKGDPGCSKLRNLIAEHIPWDRLPSTSTTELFKALKDAVIEIKEAGIVLIRLVELEQRLRLAWEGEPFEEQDLRTVIGLLAGQGVIQPLDFGDFVLLQPEQINSYGSAVVRAARNSETELAELSEQDVLEANIDFQDMERLKQDDEKILLRAMLQIFVERGLCYRVDTIDGPRLAFPAYFKHDRPEIPEQPNVVVTYGFEGLVDEIYSTLVVRLHYTNDFEIDRLWRYAGDFKPLGAGRAGLMLIKEKDDAAKIKVYFDCDASIDNKVSFIKYIHEHLKRYAEDVTRVRDYVCPQCDTPLDNKKAIAKRRELGFTDIVCGVCEERVVLQDLIEDRFESDDFLINVRKMDEQAQIRLDYESLELILVGHAFSTVDEAGHTFRPITNSDRGIDGEIVFKNDKGDASGQRLYLRLKAVDSFWRGRRHTDSDYQHYAHHWQISDVPVMMVFRTAEEKINWMNLTEYVKRHGTESGLTNFESESFTAINVHKMWRQLTGDGA